MQEKSYKKMTRCICPRCGKTYKRMMKWKGNGTPRKFCTDCKPITVEYIDSNDIILNLPLANNRTFG